SASASNLNFSAAVGPLSVGVSGGTFALDSDGAGSATTPATFAVTLTGDGGTHRLYLDHSPLSQITVGVNGKLDLHLPVSFLGQNSSVDLSTTLSAASGINNLPLPDFTGAANGGSFNLGQSFGAVIDGIAGALDKLNQAVKSALGANIPLVGGQLS